jgi:hypothetical protein
MPTLFGDTAMPMTAYKVITGGDPDELERKVLAAATDDDYLPVGAATYDPNARLYMQTMIVGDTAGPGA